MVDEGGVGDIRSDAPVRLELYVDEVDNVVWWVSRAGEVDSARHQATPLPMSKECEICLQRKSTKSPSRRRLYSRMAADSAGALERPSNSIPARDRSTETVVGAIHIFEGPDLPIRRWWSDGAPEVDAATSRVRSQRPLAHYRTVPRRPQSNGVAERSNRMVVEGARCAILQSGLNEDRCSVPP